jgi:serine/threonine protein kinase
MAQMCSGQVPFGIGCRPGDAYETPPYDDSFDLFPEYWDFVERCLAGIPMSRPSACEVHKQMEDFLKSIPP